MRGGVAKNPAARKALEDRFRIRFLVPDEPQLTGALGAALIAFERSRSLPRTVGPSSGPAC
jgi:activator of 2-hydroxyglutaryl-CoA dehydratase